MPDNKLMSVDQALKMLLVDVESLSPEVVALDMSIGRILAQDIKAELDLPPFHNSSMDGFAVRAEDVSGASKQNPIRLEVVGDISAGVGQSVEITENQAARIMTGGVLPQGADSVVPVEYTSSPEALAEKELSPLVEIRREVSLGAFIRAAGQDVQQGAQILSKGHQLRAQDIGMLAALGLAELNVYTRPRVAVLSTGDELVDVGKQLSPGQIFDSNGYAISAALVSAGAIPDRVGIVPDDPSKLRDALMQCVKSRVDLIISSAGVSMGAYDFVRPVIEKHGQLDFWKVNVRPGKPILRGAYQGIPFIGLPGNPVSALVTFEIFVKPVVYKLCGRPIQERITIPARLSHEISTDGRESYLRASVNQIDNNFEVQLVGSQDSGVLSSLVEANALIRLPAGREKFSKGEIVDVWFLRLDGIM
jgi:molybdopterin molybdotransferase